MKYQPTLTPIPFARRADVNAKILAILDAGVSPGSITQEDIFNGYTGIGGLHGYDRADYGNYNEFADAKKEFEQGQFFTPAHMVEAICKQVPISHSDSIVDLTCGAGAFFNSLPEAQCHGCDIDQKAIRVAKYLYPEAHIECADIRSYNPGMQFDFVFGNPPFNLKWTYQGDEMLSQAFFCHKAADLLKPGGVLICIVPESFLSDDFWSKAAIAHIDERFSFLFQYKIDPNTFSNMGVVNFRTKVICFMRLADAIEKKPYKAKKFVTYEQAGEILKEVGTMRERLRLKFHQETLMRFSTKFQEQTKKYLYEFKAHKVLQPYVNKAMKKLDQLYTQKQPEGLKYEDWERSRLTEGKVLAFFRQIMAIQSRKERDEYRWVKNNYGWHLKAYSRKAAVRMGKLEPVKAYKLYDLVNRGAHPAELPNYAYKIIDRKAKGMLIQKWPWVDMGRDEKIDKYLKRFGFYDEANQICGFNDIQRNDLGLVLQKPYAILNWQQGSGKTPAAAAWARWKPQTNTFVVSAALGLNLTWEKFMKLHNRPYIMLKTITDVANIQPGMFVLVSLDYLIKLQRHIGRYIKRNNYRVNLIFDESDEITNPGAKRTNAVLSCFRRVRRKLLTTGTTTRNNIAELYSQLELIYNNSYNMICTCSYTYFYDKEEGIKERSNGYYGEPYPVHGGPTLFKSCFNPAKTTVLGIQKHNQDLFNEEDLRKLLNYTIITRKFKEIAGDKYFISTREVSQNQAEEALYNKIVTELNVILPNYYNSTGDVRRDAMLRLLRQLELLIDATSMPHLFSEYEGDELPGKPKAIFDLVAETNTKMAIGCTSLKAVEWYEEELRQRFPNRLTFKVIGDISFNRRAKIIKAFESTEDGILIATQQSLKSSVNIPTCDRVIIESKQWNIPRIEQFFFRFIRYNSKNVTEVTFVNYRNTIEMNLMALLLVKERLNDYIKTLEYRENSDIYAEYDVDLDILNSLITKEYDDDGKVYVSWGKAEVV